MRAHGLRQKLILKLQQKGITDARVLAAIGKIPRHLYMPEASLDFAYRDVAYDIGVDQTISRPHTVAVQSSLLDIKAGDKVLEIGTGSGYQASVLRVLGAKVYSIERQEALYHKTNKLLQSLGLESIRTILGDGYKGLERFAPFDKIVVTCGADYIPQSLLDQLIVGGILVIPLGEGDNKTMLRIIRRSSHEYAQTNHGTFSFVPFKAGTSHRKIGERKRNRTSKYDPNLPRVVLD